MPSPEIPAARPATAGAAPHDLPYALLRAWDIGVPGVPGAPGRQSESESGVSGGLRPAPSGANNLTWVVECGAARYVLRVQLNDFTLDALRWEHALLGRLAGAGLSFAVAAPLPARSGETLVLARGAGLNGADAWAALFPVLPGAHPRAEDREPPLLGALGSALGELDAALARVGATLGWRAIPTYGQLDRIHPLVPDPYALPEDVGLSADELSALYRVIRSTWEAVPQLYATLPQQVIHSDYVDGNVLVLDGRVSAVLDFEFADRDLRAMDPATALYGMARGPWRPGGRWEEIEAVARGYAARQPLRGEEVAALPVLLRLRLVVGILHWMGRWRQGAADPQSVCGGTRAALRLDGWLAAHGAELVERATSWLGEPA
jgi:homoserine kinase type II